MEDSNSNNTNNTNKNEENEENNTNLNTNTENEKEKEDNIFRPNKKLEEEIKENCGIPNWGEMIFGLFNEKLRKKLIETSKKNEGYHNFILGVTNEYGIDTEINYEMALKYYQKAADLKESFALYKLYTLHSYQNEIFKVKRNREKEIFYLLESIAFSDAAFFMNNDTFFKIDIFYEINLIFDLETNLVIKLNKLFNNKNLENSLLYSDSDSDLLEKKNDLIYLESIITLKFLGEKHNIDILKQHEIFDKIRKLAENKHTESCYKLAVIYRQSKNKLI